MKKPLDLFVKLTFINDTHKSNRSQNIFSNNALELLKLAIQSAIIFYFSISVEKCIAIL